MMAQREKPAPLGKIALAAAATALIWAGCCLALAERARFPEPVVQDEFSYLLGADTFAHGRMANPEHPLSRFFESPHILVRPKYASKYPPGQALFLGLGEKLFGSPYYGVLISGALMMFLFTMTLVAWSSFVPGVAVAAVLGLLFLPPMYWVYSYWGGCVAAAAGAAVLLAFNFQCRDYPMAAGVTFGCGALGLFLTRPYEGGVFTLACVAACAFRLWRRCGGRRVFLLSAAPVILAGALWAGWYDAAITGNPLQLPYLLYDGQNATTPVFWFLPLRADPQYSSPRLAAQHSRSGREARKYREVRAGGFLGAANDTVDIVVRLFGGTLILLALVPLAWRDWRIRLMAAVLGASFVALSIETYHQAHYAAPFTAAVALLAACAMETAWWIRSKSVPYGAIFACLVFAVACAFPLASAVRFASNGAGRERTFGDTHAELVHRLSEMDGDHLVIVRYPSPDWRLGDEWVYNRADIDSQRVVFAHDLGKTENEMLLHYYSGRRAWLLTFDGDRLTLTPYPIYG
jgi:hypothetical protein